MKKWIAFLLICLMVLCIGCNKTKTVKPKTFDGWITVKMKNEVEFQIPPTMEIQKESYTAIGEKAEPGLHALLTVPDSNRIVAQQLGLNAINKGAFKHYVRAIMEIIDSPEDVSAFGDTLKFTNKELEELTNDIRENFYKTSEQFKANDSRHRSYLLVGITTPCKVVKVNGIDVLFCSYDTQLADNPFVNNYIYLFFNKKKIYKLSILIRSTEQHLWTAEGKNVLDVVQTVHPIDKK